MNIKIKKQNFFIQHILMVAYAFGWALTFSLEVRLYAAEILTIISLLIVNWQSALRRYPIAQQIIKAYLLWMLAIALSDVVNNTDLFNFAKNISTPIIGACSLLIILSILSKNPNSIITFLIATAFIKSIFGEAQYGESFSEEVFGWDAFRENMNYFKVRIEPFLTPALLVISCWISRNSLKNAAFLLVTSSIVYFAVDARSSAGVIFLAGLIMFLLGYKDKIKIRKITFWLLVFFIGYIVFLCYVTYVVSINPDGHAGKQFIQAENIYNPLEVLMYGRSEWLVLPEAISERPIFGWGSWAVDSEGKFNSLRILLLNISNSDYSEYIPVHSLLGAAWIWSGALGFIAMMLLLKSIINMTIRLQYIHSFLLPAAIYFTLLTYWHFFFSPPQHVRLTFPIALALLIVLTDDLSQVEKVNKSATLNRRAYR